MPLIKTTPPITIEASRDLYAYRFVIRSRRPANKLQPEQQATILRAAADQLRTWAEQMDDEAAILTETVQ
jgi:hypothetical protein